VVKNVVKNATSDQRSATKNTKMKMGRIETHAMGRAWDWGRISTQREPRCELKKQPQEHGKECLCYGLT
jgi:hypothetical protein